VTMQVTSSAFANEADIPKKFTGEGEDVSPPLKWSDPPAGTKSLALICDDPDAPRGTWVHWVLWGLKPSARSLPEDVKKDKELPDGIKQGNNSWPSIGYRGPMPPPGRPHRYYFKLYALDTELSLKPGATKPELEKAMEGHILAKGETMGRYKR